MKNDAPGFWTFPLHDVAAWSATDRAFNEAKLGKCPVEIVVGSGYSSDEFKVPLRMLGYGAVVLRNIELCRKQFGGKAEINVRLFCSAPKLAGLGNCIKPSDAFGAATVALAGLAGALDGLGVREFVRSLSVDAARADREIPEQTMARTVYALQHHPHLKWLDDEVKHFGSSFSNGAEPLTYGIEHAAGSMFGDVDGRNILHVTIGGAAERVFWVIRRTVAAISREQGVPTIPAIARVITSIKRAWYHPMQEEPSLVDILDNAPANLTKQLIALSDEERNRGLKCEAKATPAAIVRIGPDSLRALALTTLTPNAAYAFLANGNYRLGSNLKTFWSNT